MKVVPFRRKYSFLKKEVQVLLDSQDIQLLISILQEVQEGFLEDDMEDVNITLNSILEDLHDYLLLFKQPILSLHVLEIDSLMYALETWMYYYSCRKKERKIILKYINQLFPYAKLNEKEIAQFYNLPLEEKVSILEFFYRSPFGTEIKK